MKKYLSISLFAICLVMIAMAVSFIIPTAVDWYGAFRPATLAVLSGLSPFGWGFFHPPWVLVLIAPLALVPPPFDRGLFFVVSLLAFAYSAYKLGDSPVSMGLFLLSAPVVTCLYDGQLEALVLLGATLPPPLGLFLVCLKPQAGIGLILYWMIAAWRAGGLRRLFFTFGPVAVVFLLSLVVYGPWPLLMMDTLSLGWNYSLFPWSVPFGAALMIFAVRQADDKSALAAGPCLAPYLGLHSWVVLFPWLFSRPWLLALVSAATWIIWLVNSFKAI